MKKVSPMLSLLLLLTFLLAACTQAETSVLPGTSAPPSETLGAVSERPTPSVMPSESEPLPPSSAGPEKHVHNFQNGACACGRTTVEALRGKAAIFLGDSIVMAQNRDEEHPWWGYAGRIDRDYELGRYKNVSVDGASVSDCWKPNTLTKQIAENRRGPKYHFVVLEGGTNDAWTATAVGKMSDIPPEEVTADTFKDKRNTFCGGLEDTLYHATTAFEGASFLYVITPKMNRTEGKLQEMQLYVDATLEICEKWGIPCLNLYNMDASFYGEDMDAYFATYVPDGVHPNSAGYDKLTPYIADAMATYSKFEK